MNGNDGDSPIKKFYEGRAVLVTGATGFMGKILIEKLLRSTKVKRIYLLVRSKKSKSVQQRSTELFEDVIFSRLKDEVKDYRERIHVVEGDVSMAGLGLTNQNLHLLQSELEVIFHGAATVRFNEEMNRAIAINVRGTKEVLQLAKKCVNLKAIVHISTAYSNCIKSEVPEDFFEPPVTADNMLQVADCLSEKQLQDISQILLGDYPNTYAFTKAIAENVVKVYGQNLPAVVFRPAIVVATAEEPLKGWIDNIYGPTGVVCGVGAGLLRTFEVNRNCIADLVPVDLAVNAIIASAWDISLARNTDDIPVYNYVSSCDNPLRWGRFIDTTLNCGRQMPWAKAMWYYTMVDTKYHLLHLFWTFLLHLLPAMIIDTALVLTGRSPKMWGIYSKIRNFAEVIAYFSKRQWQFHNDRVHSLWRSMNREDQETFNFDISTVHWDTYLKNLVIGIRVNFFKDTPDTIPAGLRRQFYFYVLHLTLKVLLIGAVLGTLYSLGAACGLQLSLNRFL